MNITWPRDDLDTTNEEFDYYHRTRNCWRWALMSEISSMRATGVLVVDGSYINFRNEHTRKNSPTVFFRNCTNSTVARASFFLVMLPFDSTLADVTGSFSFSNTVYKLLSGYERILWQLGVPLLGWISRLWSWECLLQ
jgi:hypothetical protein